MSTVKDILILNLVENLSDSLNQYFDEAQITLLNRSEVEDYEKLDFIIVSSAQEARDVCRDFDTDNKGIRIICIGNIKDVKSYLLSNGRLFIDQNFTDSELGRFVLNKFFFKNYNIHLDESFSSIFGETKEFKVTNHLSSGLSIDQISLDAFDKGFNIVSLRSFIDHSIYYLTYLKQAGLAGIPYEFEYSSTEEIFVVNMYASVKNFVAEYMIDAFGDLNEENPLSYLLNIVQKNCDFLDITYLENPGKIVFTAFWSKSSTDFKGLAFNNIQTTAQALTQLEKQIKEYTPELEVINQVETKQILLSEKALPGGLTEIVQAVDKDSVLSKQPHLLANTVEKVIDQFQANNPSIDISEMNEGQFQSVLESSIDDNIIIQLTDKDRDAIKERAQKSKLIEAYNNESLRIKETVESDDEIQELLSDTLSDQVAQSVSSHVNADILNKILAPVNELDDLEGDPFGSIPTQFIDPRSGESVEFDPDKPGEFIDPVSGQLVKLDPSSPEEFTDPTTGETVSINVTQIPDPATNVTGSPDEDSIINIAGGFEGSGEEEQVIKAMPKEGDPVIKIGGNTDDPNDHGTLVKGGKESADDFVTKINGFDEQEKGNFLNVISSGLDEKDEKGVFSFKSLSKGEQDKKINSMVVKSLNAPELDTMDLKVKGFLQKEAPSLISNALGDFATALGMDVNDLSERQIAEFKSQHIPAIMDNLLKDEKSINEFHKELELAVDIAPKTAFNDMKQVVDISLIQNSSLPVSSTEDNFQRKFKNKLEEKLEHVASIDKDDNHYKVSDENLSEDEVQAVIKQTMKETFEEEFNIKGASEEEITQQEAQIVKKLSKTLDMPQDVVQKIVSDAAENVKEKEKQLVAQKAFEQGGAESSNIGEAALMSKLKKVEDENKALRNNLSAMDVKLKASLETTNKIEQINEKSKATDEEISKAPASSLELPEQVLSDEKKEELVTNLKEGKALSAEDSALLAQAIEREKQLAIITKQAEVEIKKAQIEISKKDSFFRSEMDKANKVVKAKELVLDKAKETMKTIVSKKEQELVGLKAQVNNLNNKLQNDQSTQLKAQLQSLSQQNETLGRTTDVYKNKLESMAKSIEKNKKADNSAQLSQEVRSLKKIKNQLENKAKADAKSVRSLEERYNTTKAVENKLKNEVAQAKAQLKNTELQFRTFKETQARINDQLTKSQNSSVDKVSKELDFQKSENSKLKAKLAQVLAESQQLKDEKLESSNTPDQAQSTEIEKNAAKAVEAAKREAMEAHETIDDLSKKLVSLEQKLKTSMKASNSGGSGDAGAGSANEKRLEQSVKKMNAELTKTRAEMAEKKKEFMKNKTEITGLKNKLQAAAREIEKLKKASTAKAKKAGAKKAA